jgi:hypothetical protein
VRSLSFMGISDSYGASTVGWLQQVRMRRLVKLGFED